jgi:tyrosinase
MVHIRKNHLALSPEERRRFIGAVVEMKRRGVYDEFVRIHIDRNSVDYNDKVTGKRFGHVNPGFLPWHRQYLYLFERELRKIDPRVTLPYWDWTTDGSVDSPLWDEEFMGGTGRPGDGMVTTGAFAYANGWVLNISVVPVGPEDPAVNGHYTTDDRKFLVRDIGAKLAKPSGPEVLEQTMELPVYDSAPWGYTSGSEAPYPSFRNHLEGYTLFPWESGQTKLHGAGHQFVGGHMGYIGSPNDPVFFLHHCFVDKVWSDWQRRHPQVPHYLPEHATADVPGLDTLLPPWNTHRVRDLVDHRRLYLYR